MRLDILEKLVGDGFDQSAFRGVLLAFEERLIDFCHFLGLDHYRREIALAPVMPAVPIKILWIAAFTSLADFTVAVAVP